MRLYVGLSHDQTILTITKKRKGMLSELSKISFGNARAGPILAFHPLLPDHRVTLMNIVVSFDVLPVRNESLTHEIEDYCSEYFNFLERAISN